MINAQLLRDTLAHIEAHPEEWDQGTYRLDCGTAGCFAFHAALIAGGMPHPDGDEDLFEREPDPPDDYDYPDEDAQWISVMSRATRVLGLDGGAANRLFSARNTLDDLRRIVAELTTETTP